MAEPEVQVRKALEILEKEISMGAYRHATLRWTEPLAEMEQPAYVKSLATFMSDRGVGELLAQLQDIENRMGRVRTERWGLRSIDLDLLLAGDECVDSPHLTLPHPGMVHRSFLLEMLIELDPLLLDPISGLTYAQLLKRLRARSSSLKVTQ